MEIRHRRVHVVVELGKAIHVLPDVLHRGVEDVGTVLVDVDPLNILGVDIARDVVASIDDEHRLPSLLRGIGEHGAGKARADDQIVKLLHSSLL